MASLGLTWPLTQARGMGYLNASLREEELGVPLAGKPQSFFQGPVLEKGE